jgi:dolichol-phosphate mannosyltransferase
LKVSIVIPTFNERDNVSAITTRIQSVLSKSGLVEDAEIWFIDDSRDDTPEVLEQLSKACPLVHYVHREERRGLGTAVVEGFSHCQGEYIIVMDADLQHPPELLPVLIEKLQEGADVVVPSRFIPGGSDGGLNAFRKLVSWTARTIGRLAIRRLRHVTDCTGGYFGIRREVIQDVDLNPIGWKILMEILVKGRYETLVEVPYKFTARDAGESKMSLKEQWNYLRHIAQLVSQSPEDRRFFLFCLVGGLGTLVNLFFLSVFLYVFHWHGTTASVAASLIAMGHNFLLNDQLTWRERWPGSGSRRWLQFVLFVAISFVSIVVTAVFVWLFEKLRGPVLVGQIIGIAVATGWSFTANNRLTWAKSRVEPATKRAASKGS